MDIQLQYPRNKGQEQDDSRNDNRTGSEAIVEVQDKSRNSCRSHRFGTSVPLRKGQIREQQQDGRKGTRQTDNRKDRHLAQQRKIGKGKRNVAELGRHETEQEPLENVAADFKATFRSSVFPVGKEVYRVIDTHANHTRTEHERENVNAPEQGPRSRKSRTDRNADCHERTHNRNRRAECP